MWAYIVRKLLYNIPVYLSTILVLFLMLRVNDPVRNYLGKNASEESREAYRQQMGLDQPIIIQYGKFMWNTVRLDFSDESWAQPGRSTSEVLRSSIIPSLSITVPSLILSTTFGVSIAIISAYFRGRMTDRVVMTIAVLGMSVSYLVYIIFGQYWFASLPAQAGGFSPFETEGYEPWIGGDPFFAPGNWVQYCMLPVLIGVIVSLGYDTRFYRAVMVEESNRDYMITALAKGASKPKIMFVHMLKNAMIPIVTRVMSTLPFLIMGSILVELYFNIPGMGKELITAINANDFPVIQALVAVLAAIFILTIILTDVVYALVDPRVRLS